MRRLGPAALVERLGGRASEAFQLRLEAEDDAAIGRWFTAACLLSARASRALPAFRALAGAGLVDPAALAAAETAPVVRALEEAAFPKPLANAAKLVRAAAALRDRHAGSFGRLAASAESLEDLAGRIAGLAPGVGAATVLRFLRELRGIWRLADEIALSPAAHAAAVHLGLLERGEDLEGAPGALSAALLRCPEAPAVVDVEAALHRLGARACLRGRPERCPLGEACPARTAAPP